MPLRLLADASHAYFEPILPDFAPWNMWSLHNALTTVATTMPMTTQLPAIQAGGKLFGMTRTDRQTA